MAGHAPYLMPDGRSLQQYLRTEREKEMLRTKKVETQRAKDEQFSLLVLSKQNATEREIAEIKVIESAGARRRRRYLNEKVLR